MILVDTSVWVEHLRKADDMLVHLLGETMILSHPFVIGELALGNLSQRGMVLNAISDLPRSTVATDEEVLHLIDQHALWGRGVGYVDAHLLASVRLTPGAKLWTVDRRLGAVATAFGRGMELH